MRFGKSMRRVLLAVAAIMTSGTALAETYTQGVGLAARVGDFAGMSGGGLEANIRLGTIEFTGGAMQGEDIISDDLDPSFFGIHPYDIQKSQINQSAVTALLKLHPMNGSFYFGFGGMQVHDVAVLKADSKTVSGEFLDETITTDRTLSTVSVGNIRTPGGVIIGCEWVAIHSAVKSKETATSKSVRHHRLRFEDAEKRL